MAYLAIRGSGAINGVSKLHGQVSRRLFQPLFPRWPEAEVPVTHVTNGVHTPSWDSAEADRLWELPAENNAGTEHWQTQKEIFVQPAMPTSGNSAQITARLSLRTSEDFTAVN
jgi:starch phosphorylase